MKFVGDVHFRVYPTLIVEDPIVTVQCRTAINAVLFYFTLCLSVILDSLSCSSTSISFRGRRGRNRIVIEFLTTCGISTYHHKSCEFEPRLGTLYSIQHYVIKFVSDLRQDSGFLLVLRFSPPIKLTITM